MFLRLIESSVPRLDMCVPSHGTHIPSHGMAVPRHGTELSLSDKNFFYESKI